MTLRHVDDGVYKYQFIFADQWVHCPDCETPGIIHYQKLMDDSGHCECRSHFIFTCRKCNRHLDSHSKQYNKEFNGHYYISLTERCHFCGGTQLSVNHKIHHFKNPVTHAEAACPICNKTSQLSVKSHDIDYAKANRLEHTQFGLKLYLTAHTRFGNLYIHNPEHLQSFKSFVQAGLRERTQNTGNSSYFSRLPAWIKSARNRKEILKAILRLEQMASTIQP
jgi:hypothetical protein